MIELLAVIVILAIIALIATPIVLNIISDTKEEADLRSAQFYLDALELSIAESVLEENNIIDKVYEILDNGNICLIEENDECKDELEVDVKGEIPKGSISIKSGKIDSISLVFSNKTIIKNKKGELTNTITLEDICQLKEGNPKTEGSKYECTVKPGTSYTFYVLPLILLLQV